MKKKLICLLLALLVLSGCAAKTMDMEAAMEAPMESNKGVYDVVYDYGLTDSAGTGVQTKPQGSVATSQGVTPQKLIRTMELEVETNELDGLLAFLDEKVAQLGGYMEERSVRNGSATATRRYRYANMTIRVPVDKLDQMVEHIGRESNVVNSTENADDITLSYVATESRIKALEVEQQRLLELLAKAGDMSDLLQIEARLTEVRTELEEVASRLRLYDNLVDYGTVRLSITEVQVFTPVERETVWQRIGAGLKENWAALTQGAENLFVFLVTSLPYLIPLSLVAVIVLVAVRLALKKPVKTKKEEDDPAQ